MKRARRAARGPRLERLSCRRRVELLCAYLDRELPSSQRVVVDLHRRSCKPCAQLLASLSRTVRVLRRLKAPSRPPAAARKALRAALKSGARRSR